MDSLSSPPQSLTVQLRAALSTSPITPPFLHSSLSLSLSLYLSLSPSILLGLSPSFSHSLSLSVSCSRSHHLSLSLSFLLSRSLSLLLSVPLSCSLSLSLALSPLSASLYYLKLALPYPGVPLFRGPYCSPGGQQVCDSSQTTPPLPSLSLPSGMLLPAHLIVSPPPVP